MTKTDVAPTALPQGWEWADSSKLFSFVTSGSRGWAKYYSDTGPIFIRIGNLDHDSISLDLNQIQRVIPPKDTEGTRTRIQPGDVLISITADVGMVAIVPEGIGEAYINQHVALARPVEEIERKFLAWFLASREHGLAQLRRLQRGATKVGLGLDDIKAIKVPLPPLPEQSKIVSKLEELFTKLDAGVEALKKAQALLKRYRASVLKAACEGRLVPTEAELARQEGRDYEPAGQLLARILKERRAAWEAAELAKMARKGIKPKNDAWKKKYQEPAIPETEGLPELPEGWMWASLNSIILWGPQNGLYLPKESYGEGTPILRIDDFQNGESRSSKEMLKVKANEEEIIKYSLNVGDLVINRVNSMTHLGKCLLVSDRNTPAVFESNMMRMLLSKLICIEYVELYLHSKGGRAKLVKNAKWAVNQASINQVDVSITPVPLPPLAEQVRIADALKEKISIDLACSEELKTLVTKANKLRQGILSSAFQGKLVPQDPNDEPASVLLERIKDARAQVAPGRKPTRARRATRRS